MPSLDQTLPFTLVTYGYFLQSQSHLEHHKYSSIAFPPIRQADQRSFGSFSCLLDIL